MLFKYKEQPIGGKGDRANWESKLLDQYERIDHV